jgi:hypothetical protein
MSKIINENFPHKSFIDSNYSNVNGNGNGNCYGYADGSSFSNMHCDDCSSGNSWAPGWGHDYFSSIVDPSSLTPLTFVSEYELNTWDEAWEIATEEEKMVLIQWIGLR